MEIKVSARKRYQKYNWVMSVGKLMYTKFIGATIAIKKDTLNNTYNIKCSLILFEQFNNAYKIDLYIHIYIE